MQLIKHGLHNIHPVFDDIESIYAYTSVKEHPKTLINPVFNRAFESVLETFNEYGYTNYQVDYKDTKYKPLDTPKSAKKVIVCFSGGKDSTATALYYREKKYKVYLYHLKGINFTYKDEWKTVEKLADKMGMELIIDNVELTGKQEWIEHPLKNWIVASRALQWGITHNVTSKIAFGNFSTSSLDNDPFDVCGGDCRELWELYSDVMGNVVKSNFKILTPLYNMQDSLDILMEHKDIATECQSCIGAYRYRDYLHKKNCKKFGLDLPEHRCFSCWKCCLEYIVYTDNDIYEYNKDMYEHCLDILKKTLKNEQNIRVDRDDVWEHYFFYSREDSKYYGKCRK